MLITNSADMDSYEIVVWTDMPELPILVHVIDGFLVGSELESGKIEAVNKEPAESTLFDTSILLEGNENQRYGYQLISSHLHLFPF